MKELNFYNNDPEVNAVIHKGMEIFAVIKNTILKMNNEILSMEDKKALSLLLGIEYTENTVSKKLKQVFYIYGITVYTMVYDRKECIELYEEYFKSLIDGFELDSDFTVEQLMMKLLDISFISKLHEYNNYPINRLRIILNESLKSKKLIKTLQN